MCQVHQRPTPCDSPVFDGKVNGADGGKEEVEAKHEERKEEHKGPLRVVRHFHVALRREELRSRSEEIGIRIVCKAITRGRVCETNTLESQALISHPPPF